MLSFRKIGLIGRSYRHIRRYRKILSIFFKYGLGDIIDLLQIEQYVEIGRQLISRERHERVDKLSRAERVRLAFEELGPTFIKFGQVLSTHPGMMPADIIRELVKLQDKVPPFGIRDVREIIRTELGESPDRFFETFEETPLASASIGQVHKARLKTGEDVVVKVQRPGIMRIVEIDLEIMHHMATLMEKTIEEMALHRPTRIVEEFARTLEKELDYTIEASNMQRFAAQFRGDPHIHIPTVYRDVSTSRVLTMEYIDGIKITDIEKLQAAGLDPKRITNRGSDLLLKMVFDHGFFHADPHPGNVFVLPGNIICFLDYGMVGSVDRKTTEMFVDFLISAVQGDIPAATQVLLNLTLWEDEPDIRRLEKDLNEFIGQHLYQSLKNIEISKMFQQVFEISFRHRLRVPPDLYLMLKAFTSVEGIASILNPEFDMVAKSEPFIRRVKLGRYYPKRVALELLKIGNDLNMFIRQFPGDLLTITRLIKQKKLSITLDTPGMEAMLDRIVYRISFAVIIAAILISSAMIVIAGVPPLLFGISVLGVFGFLVAGVLGTWLVISILLNRRL